MLRGTHGIRFLVPVISSVAIWVLTHVLDAQITFDGSLGAGGAFTADVIPANRGTAAGANLFHSFSDFNVGSGQAVHFEASALTRNVLARVTGSSLSQINGTLGTRGTGGGGSAANLFLLNPNGIMFGEGARVDVSGSFTATTADYLSFRDESGTEVGRFWASGGGDVSMLTPPPAAFGFLDSSNEGPIGLRLGNTATFDRFSNGQLSLVGRQLDLRDSYLDQQNGSLTLHALQQGEVETGGSIPDNPGVAQDSAITLTDVFIESLNGHRVAIESRGELLLKDGFLSSITRNEGTENHGQVILQAAGDVIIDRFSASVINRGSGNGGEITVAAGGDLRVTNSAQIQTGYAAGGSGPGISVTTGGDLRIDRFGLITSDSRTAGSGGAIDLVIDGSTVIKDFGLVLSTAAGNATGGKISLNTPDLLIQGPAEVDPPDQMLAPARTTGIESVTEGTGFGGSIEANVSGDVGLYNSGGIFTSSNGTGTSGSIHLDAANLEVIGIRNFLPGEDDMRPKNFFITGISNKRARNDFTGSLGSITVDVDGEIRLLQGGLIDASNFSLDPDATSGDVTVAAERIFADRMNSDYFTGIGSGTVADESLDISDGGRGGTVAVSSPSIELLNGAQIAASSRSGGDAGVVEVFTNKLSASGAGPVTPFLFTGESGVVSATRGSATGAAGGVTIREYPGLPADAGRPGIRLSDRAEIGARADGSGDGGSVVIEFPNGTITLEPMSTITARSGTLGGIAGSVTITADRLTLNGGVVSTTNAALQTIAPDAGDVTLFPRILIVDGGRLQVSALGGNAGDLRILGARLIDLRRAEVVAEALSDGGSIEIDDTTAVLLDRSTVSANAINGTGGNIDIAAEVFLNNSSTVTASSEFGVDGVVEIDRTIALTGAESRLEASALDASDQIQPECTQRLDTEVGSFIRSGRGGSTRLPGGYLPSVRLHRTN